jgi:hypothetical protein
MLEKKWGLFCKVMERGGVPAWPNWNSDSDRSWSCNSNIRLGGVNEPRFQFRALRSGWHNGSGLGGIVAWLCDAGGRGRG